MANSIDKCVALNSFLSNTKTADRVTTKEVDSLKSVLLEETTRIQEALYSIPEVAGAIPKAFILADPNALLQTSFNLEDDGFEII